MDSTTRFDFRPPQFSEEFTWLPDWIQQNQSQRPVAKKKVSDRWRLCRSLRESSTEEILRTFEKMMKRDLPIFSCSCLEKIVHRLILAHTLPDGARVKPLMKHRQWFDHPKDFPVEKVRSTARPSAKTSARGNSFRKLERHVKDDDLDASVELFIMTSEAVVIHELAESEPALRRLPMESVVEIAMRVKEARLQKIDDASDVLMEDACADDSLMALDDLTMLEAFQDSGLPMVVHDESGFCDADISQVQETPVAELHKTINCEYECLDIRRRTCRSSGQSDSLTELALEEQLKEKFPLESLSFHMVRDVSKELPSISSLLLPREKA